MAKTTKPIAKVIGHIYETREYSKFSFEKGNREINRNHVESLKKSFQKHYFISPIDVDTKGKIKDGQHRFTAAQELNYPVRYSFVTSKGETPINVAEMNLLTKKWTSRDFAHSYASKGNNNYELYNQFRDSYPEFAHSLVISLLAGRYDRSSKTEEEFRTGTLIVKDYAESERTAETILSTKPFYKGYNRRAFVYALLQIMEHPDFELSKLLRNMEKKSTMLMDFSQTADYVQALEKIYNWNNRNPLRFY